MSAAYHELEKLLLGLGCRGSEFVGAGGINALWGAGSCCWKEMAETQLLRAASKLFLIMQRKQIAP